MAETLNQILTRRLQAARTAPTQVSANQWTNPATGGPWGGSKNPAPRPSWMGAYRGQNDPWEMQPMLQADVAKKKAEAAARLLPQGAFQRQAFDTASLPTWNPNASGQTESEYQTTRRNSFNSNQDRLAEADRRARDPAQVWVDARSAVNTAAFPGNTNLQKWVGEQRDKLISGYQTNNPQGSTFNAWNQVNNPRPVASTPAPRPSPYQGMDINALFAQFMNQFQNKQR